MLISTKQMAHANKCVPQEKIIFNLLKKKIIVIHGNDMSLKSFDIIFKIIDIIINKS
jgi:hypothetical protein